MEFTCLFIFNCQKGFVKHSTIYKYSLVTFATQSAVELQKLLSKLLLFEVDIGLIYMRYMSG